MNKLILSLLFFAFSIQGIINSSPRQSQVEKPFFITATNDPIDSIITTDNQGIKNKFIYNFDENKKTTLVLQQQWNGSKWIDSYKHEYSYDSLMNLTGIFTMGWDMFGGQWVDLSRYTYTYDANGNQLTDIGENWTGSYWSIYRNRTFTYDSSNNLSTFTLLEGGAGSYYEYSYDTNNNLLITVEFVGQYDWQKHYRYSYSYGATNKPISLLKEEWADNQWDNYQNTIYEYNAFGNVIFETLKNWDSFNLLWLNGNQITYTYDANNNLIEKLNETWYNSAWVNSLSDTYAYNSDSNIKMFLHKYWYNNNWEVGLNEFDFTDYYGNFYSFFTGKVDVYYGTLVDVEEHLTTPAEFSLSQNFPNPFNPSTKITYSIPKSSYVTLKVYNILGDEVADLVDEYESSGKYSITFNASDLSSGIYFYRLQTRNISKVKKLCLEK